MHQEGSMYNTPPTFAWYVAGKIFKWLKKNNLSDEEMLKTFNCGVGFCVIAPKDNIKNIKKYFSYPYIPYEIGHVSKNKKRAILKDKLKW